jgi:hypothetical protein
MVAARHLSNWGAKVSLLLPGGEIKGIPEKQLRILKHLPIEIKKGARKDKPVELSCSFP